MLVAKSEAALEVGVWVGKGKVASGQKEQIDLSRVQHCDEFCPASASVAQGSD